MTLELKTAQELIDPALEKRWTARREKRQADVLQRILSAFIEREGPVAVNAIVTAFPDRPADVVREIVVALDEEDLIQVSDEHVVVAYPFSATATAFVVGPATGGERYACCAIDALGIAPMLGQPVHVRSQCHHCRMPLGFSVSPDGPGRDADGVMVWVEKRTEGQRRISTSL
jgi:hypothetical protein